MSEFGFACERGAGVYILPIDFVPNKIFHKKVLSVMISTFVAINLDLGLHNRNASESYYGHRGKLYIKREIFGDR